MRKDYPMTAQNLKPHTNYRCPVGGDQIGHSSLWTGAYLYPRGGDGRCICGEEMVEVVEDGHTYRVEWEQVGPFGDDWHPSSRETTDRVSAEDQYRTLIAWAETGEESVRNVRILRSSVSWEPWEAS